MVLEILTAKDQANLALSQWETAGEAPGTAFVFDDVFLWLLVFF